MLSPHSPQGWDAHRAPTSHPVETQNNKGGLCLVLCHSCMPGDGHSWKSLWLGRTWAGWGRDGAGSVPSAQGCVSPSLMGTPGRERSTVPIPSHPTPPSPRHKPGLLEDSHHWGWLTPGDNIRSQWGTAGLFGRILPLCSAAAVPGPSMQPPLLSTH